MAVPRAKKKKNRTHMSPEQKITYLEKRIEELEKQRLNEFITTVSMMFAIVIRDLWTVKGWRINGVSQRLFSMLVLFEEVANGVNTPTGEIKDAEEETGINTMNLIYNLMNKKGISEETIVTTMEKYQKAKADKERRKG